MADRKLILGIGNIGKEYDSTRHNCGFMVVEELARRVGGAFDIRKWDADIADPMSVAAWGCRALLIKPRTYVNLSGKVVQAAMSFYKLPPENLLVVVDDIHLKLGDLRLRAQGSSGGHNGLRDIERCIGKGYPRLRMGIGNAERQAQQDQVGFVLGRFAPDERDDAIDMVRKAADCCEAWLRSGVQEAMVFNGPLRPPPPKPKPKPEPADGSPADDPPAPPADPGAS